MKYRFTEEDIKKAVHQGIKYASNNPDTKIKMYDQHQHNQFIRRIDNEYIIPIIQTEIKLGMDVIYNIDHFSNDTFEVVGIRHNELELKGDWSGVGMNNSPSWVDIKHVFVDKRKVK